MRQGYKTASQAVRAARKVIKEGRVQRGLSGRFLVYQLFWNNRWDYALEGSDNAEDIIRFGETDAYAGPGSGLTVTNVSPFRS